MQDGTVLQSSLSKERQDELVAQKGEAEDESEANSELEVLHGALLLQAFRDSGLPAHPAVAFHGAIIAWRGPRT
jgi:cell envelope opacity-associated protein A